MAKKYKLFKDSKIIDVRTPQEFQEYRIPTLKMIFMIHKIL